MSTRTRDKVVTLFSSIHGFDMSRFDKTRDELRMTFNGQEPSNDDVNWTLCNLVLVESGLAGDWQMYRVAKTGMAYVLKGQNKEHEYIRICLEICHLDTIHTVEYRSQGLDHPVLFAPHFIDAIKNTRLPKDTVMGIFMNELDTTRLPIELLPLEETWQLIENEI